MKKHRYILPNCAPGAVDGLCQLLEDQGFEVVSVSIFSAQAGGAGGVPLLIPHAAVAARIPREAAETEIEKDAKEQANRIVKPFDGGIH